MTQQQLLNKICQVPGFIMLKPSSTTYGVLPISIDSRILISYLDILQCLTEELARQIKNIQVDFIAGIESAGIPLATTLSLKTNIPLLYVRKERRKKGKKKFVEGDPFPGAKAILVDDLIDIGATKKKFIKNLKTEKVRTIGVAVWFNWLAQDKKREWFRKNNIKIFYVFSFEEINETACKLGIVPKELHQLVLDFSYYPDSWTGKEGKKKFELYQKKIKKIKFKY